MNKANRASSTGGSLHTEGSISYPATAEKMLEELGRTPSQSKVFMRTHTKKKDRSQWVDKRAEDTKVNLMLIAGGRKRGQVYGCGKVPSRLKPQVYDSDDFSTASGLVDMREQVTLFNRELTHGVRSMEEHRVSNVQLHVEHAGWLSHFQRRNAISDASATAASATISARTC
ncbi:hypothetical protein PIB30_070355, partial [Stylosanthes scabra]|nr:hypothetical protein [Stylosanthes scabra]